MCNNSIPSATGLSSSQPGYAVTAGYDEVTGLDSLNLPQLMQNFIATRITPAVAVWLDTTVTAQTLSITTAQPLVANVVVSANDTILPTGTVTLTGGNYSSGAVVVGGIPFFGIAADSLATGTDTLTAQYTPDETSSKLYNSASGTASVTVTAIPPIKPAVTVTTSASSITTAQGLIVTIGGNGHTQNYPHGFD
jgi:hypothetical protein